MAASAADIEEFLTGPLLSWLQSCLPNLEPITEYSTLLDGTIIHQVYLQIDPEPSHHVTKLGGLEDQALVLGQIKNFDAIVKNLKSLYEEELSQTLLVVPECVSLGKSSTSKSGLENMKLLLLLLLGAAVQCPNKERFITNIKELDVELQHNIVECIRQVTDMQTVVLTPDAVDQLNPPTLYNHLRRLAKERDHYLNNWSTYVLSEGPGDVENKNKNYAALKMSTTNTQSSGGNDSHLAVELADWKARLRKQRQELEDKSEQLAEVREELEHTKFVLNKLRTESQEWFSEARKAASFRDELDALREKADRADRMELEIQRYKDRLADAEYFKTRISELREDNKALMETRDALEEQLQKARKRADQCLLLEAALIKLKREANDIALERDADQQKIQELIEENTHLQNVTRSVLSESNNSALDTDNECESALESGENSLSEQLTSNAQARALKLELENKRLLSTIDNMREQSLHENSEKLLELEKDKKRLSLKCEQLQENCNRLVQQNSDLEEVFKNALEENKKLNELLENQKASIDKQSIERESEKVKIQDFEKYLDSLTKDKQRIQLLCDSIQRRADDLEKSLDLKVKEVELLKPEANKVAGLIAASEELKTKIMYGEKENYVLQREVTKLKESIEEKDVSMDVLVQKLKSAEKQIDELLKEIETSKSHANKVPELEKKVQKLLSKTQMDKETIETLQKDLVFEKVHSDKVKNCLDKLGINIVDVVIKEAPIDEIVEKIVTNPDMQHVVFDIVSRINPLKKDVCFCDRNLKITEESNNSHQIEQLMSDLSIMQQQLEVSQEENAKLKVNVSTLNSQNGSLISQQMTLQLANSQLAAEKEDVIKQLGTLKDKHENLIRDHVAMQTLHEQLNTEYEALLSEKEPLKTAVRDLKQENRDFKEAIANLELKLSNIEGERDSLKTESRNLTNLRAEHSKLKEDFRNLFTASDRLKTEYRNMQEEYRSAKSESTQLKLRNSDLSGEINTKCEVITSLELEINKTNQHCELLMQMNKNLDTDRRSLMDHVSQLLTQYHELLAHSLKDKQHYHQEEKQFAEKLNSLCRQKEKLEEKIMEHYKKLDNCTTKRRGFGSIFVKKVRKAGSELMNRVPSRNRLDKSQLTLANSESGESDQGLQESIDKTKPDLDASQISGSLANVDIISRTSSRRLSASSANGGLATVNSGQDESYLRASLRRRTHNDIPTSHRNSFQGIECVDRMQGASPSPILGLGAAGSRRTVYVADDDTGVPITTQSTPIKETPTYLVYNKISTVINEPQPLIEESKDPTVDENILSDRGGTRSTNERENIAKESAIWYEYGCV